MTKKEEIILTFKDLVSEEYKDTLVCVGDRPATGRHNIILTLAAKLIAEQKKVLIISDDFDFSKELIQFADLDIVRQYSKNLLIINDHILYKAQNKVICWLDEWQDYQYVFIETNLRFLPKGLGNTKKCLKKIRQNTRNRNIILFTYLSRNIEDRNNKSLTREFSELRAFPKHISKYADKIFVLTTDDNSDIQVLRKIETKEKQYERN